MSKAKVADSIIIKVGGGIREIPREPLEITESLESAPQKPAFEQTEDVHPFGAKQVLNTRIGSGN